MSRNPVIAAWIAGGLIWGVALLGLGAMGPPSPLMDLQQVTQQTPWAGAEDISDAYERAMDGDPWGDADRPFQGVYRPAAAPDS